MITEINNDALFFATAFQHAPIGMALASPTGKWLRANRSLCDILGYSEEELMNCTFQDITHPDDIKKSLEEFQQIVEGKACTIQVMKRYVHKDGHNIWVLVHASRVVIAGSGAVYFIAQIQDLTERKKAEELLHHSDKLSLAGQLAAGIAHEIRNPLTAIRGFLQLMKTEGVKPNYFEIVFSEFQRIELILAELLILAKPHESRMQRKNIVHLLRDVVTLMGSQALMSNVLIRFTCDLRTLYVICDENQMKQVFINILKNAIDAMPDGGEARIEIHASEKEVQIVVVDHGCGIPADKLMQIGQPFFTSKKQGTGLGMMMSLKIIENHGGSIHIESVVKQGTTVKVLLPIAC